MTTETRRSGEFTGAHMVALMVAFFGVVIAVNLALAFYARSSWTGLVVENAYVASQEFNERAAEGKAQAALGWAGTLVIDGRGVGYRLLDRAGKPVELKQVSVKLRRPAYASEDQTLDLAPTGDGGFASGERVRDGLWIVEVEASTMQAPPYRDVRRVVVRGGVLK
jgi:nitrogen fixation protein FixH